MSIDFSLLFWTIFSFLLLCILLNRFLFKPVLGFMHARQKRIDDTNHTVDMADEALASRQKELSEELEAYRNTCEQRVHDAEKEAAQNKQLYLSAAAADEKKHREEAQQHIAAERERLTAELQKELPAYADALCALLSVGKEPSHGG